MPPSEPVLLTLYAVFPICCLLVTNLMEEVQIVLTLGVRMAITYNFLNCVSLEELGKYGNLILSQAAVGVLVLILQLSPSVIESRVSS